MAHLTFAPTIEATAYAINAVRATVSTDLELSAFLAAIERHHGTEHLRAAHALALELYEEARRNDPLRRIAQEMAATILRETRAVVEVTVTAGNAFSVLTLDGERFERVIALLTQIATLTGRVTHADDGEPTEYYAYFQHNH